MSTTPTPSVKPPLSSPSTPLLPSSTTQTPPPPLLSTPRKKWDSQAWIQIGFLVAIFAGVLISVVFVILPLFQSRSSASNTSNIYPPPSPLGVFQSDFWEQEGSYYVGKNGERFYGMVSIVDTTTPDWSKFNANQPCCTYFENLGIAVMLRALGPNQGFCDNTCPVKRNICPLTINFVFYYLLTNNGQNILIWKGIIPTPQYYNPNINYLQYQSYLDTQFPPYYNLFLIQIPIISCQNYIYATANFSLELIL